MTKNISLVIHGPLSAEWLEKICSDIKKAKFEFKQIVLVSYVDDADHYRERVKSLNVEDTLRIITCKDVINPGFFNINRQIKTVKAGLDFLEKDTWVVKLRNDQSVNFNRLKTYIDSLDEHKLITTNCFTRSDRLYHPSDMLLCAEYKTMYDYFSCSLMANTHLGHIMEVQSEFKKSNGEMKALKISPESWLFRNFLDKNGWTIQDTEEDSRNALKRYICLVNSWDIDYRWKDQRTPLLPAESLIFPYTFNRRPFDNAPVEKARCINRHNLAGERPTIKDLVYISLGRFLFGKFLFNFDWGDSEKKYRIKYILLKQVKILASILPSFMVRKHLDKLEHKILKAKQRSGRRKV